MATFNYGGQAVIEGVMMRGTRVAVIAVRRPDGSIAIHEEKLNELIYRGTLSKIPFVRGLVALSDALKLGTKALIWSAGIASGLEENLSVTDSENSNLLVASSLLSSAGIFFVLPAIGTAAAGKVTGTKNRFVLDMAEGGIRLSFLLGYLIVAGQLDEMKRLFAYHGAEHKTINAYEARSPLNPEQVQAYPLEHARCGTAFMLTVMMLSVLVNMVAGRPKNFFALILRRLILLPIVAGLGYEVLRFSASHADNPLMRRLIAPNLALQQLTTRPPDDSMLEVAIAALERVIAAEESAKTQG